MRSPASYAKRAVNGNSQMLRNRLSWWLANLSYFFTVSAAIILISLKPSTQYEISLYAAIPSVVWLLFCLSLSSAVCSVLCSDTRASQTKLGILAAAVANLLIMTIPALRGYPAYGRFDTLGHIGWAQHIEVTGRIDGSDFYPITHLLMAEIASIIRTDAYTLSLFLPTILAAGFMLNIYLLAK